MFEKYNKELYFVLLWFEWIGMKYLTLTGKQASFIYISSYKCRCCRWKANLRGKNCGNVEGTD
jgi:hypothetical protein